VRKLNAFLSSLSDPKNMPPPMVIASKNNILPLESPGTSSLMEKRGEQSEDANGKSGNKSRGFLPCFSHCFQSDAENGLIE
jgi:hypothetical protein